MAQILAAPLTIMGWLHVAQIFQVPGRDSRCDLGVRQTFRLSRWAFISASVSPLQIKIDAFKHFLFTFITFLHHQSWSLLSEGSSQLASVLPSWSHRWCLDRAVVYEAKSWFHFLFMKPGDPERRGPSSSGQRSCSSAATAPTVPRASNHLHPSPNCPPARLRKNNNNNNDDV